MALEFLVSSKKTVIEFKKAKKAVKDFTVGIEAAGEEVDQLQDRLRDTSAIKERVEVLKKAKKALDLNSQEAKRYGRRIGLNVKQLKEFKVVAKSALDNLQTKKLKKVNDTLSMLGVRLDKNSKQYKKLKDLFSKQLELEINTDAIKNLSKQLGISERKARKLIAQLTGKKAKFTLLMDMVKGTKAVRKALKVLNPIISITIRGMTALVRIMARIGKALLKFTKALVRVGKVLASIIRSVKNFAGGLKSAIVSILSFVGAFAALRVITDAFLKLIRVGAKFERSMATVKAITRASAEEFQMLTKRAREVASVTEFTATQTAEGMRFLAMAGLDVNEVMTAIEGTINLATVAQIGLGEAADWTTNIMTGMGIEVESLSQLNDVLVGTITRANTDMRELAEAFKFVSSSATSTGHSVVDVSSFLAVLSNSGLKASVAGRNLSRAFIQLDKVAGKLGLGGTGISLVQVLEEIERQGWSSTRVMREFGVVGGRAAIQILKNLDSFRVFRQELSLAGGELEKARDTIQDTVIGQYKQLLSVLEDIGLSVFSAFGLPLKNSLKLIVQALRANKGEIVATITSILKVVAELAVNTGATVAAGLTVAFDVMRDFFSDMEILIAKIDGLIDDLYNGIDRLVNISKKLPVVGALFQEDAPNPTTVTTEFETPLSPGDEEVSLLDKALKALGERFKEFKGLSKNLVDQLYTVGTTSKDVSEQIEINTKAPRLTPPEITDADLRTLESEVLKMRDPILFTIEGISEESQKVLSEAVTILDTQKLDASINKLKKSLTNIFFSRETEKNRKQFEVSLNALAARKKKLDEQFDEQLIKPELYLKASQAIRRLTNSFLELDEAQEELIRNDVQAILAERTKKLQESLEGAQLTKIVDRLDSVLQAERKINELRFESANVLATKRKKLAVRQLLTLKEGLNEAKKIQAERLKLGLGRLSQAEENTIAQQFQEKARTRLLKESLSTRLGVFDKYYDQLIGLQEDYDATSRKNIDLTTDELKQKLISSLDIQLLPADEFEKAVARIDKFTGEVKSKLNFELDIKFKSDFDRRLDNFSSQFEQLTPTGLGALAQKQGAALQQPGKSKGVQIAGKALSFLGKIPGIVGKIAQGIDVLLNLGSTIDGLEKKFGEFPAQMSKLFGNLGKNITSIAQSIGEGFNVILEEMANPSFWGALIEGIFRAMKNALLSIFGYDYKRQQTGAQRRAIEALEEQRAEWVKQEDRDTWSQKNWETYRDSLEQQLINLNENTPDYWDNYIELQEEILEADKATVAAAEEMKDSLTGIWKTLETTLNSLLFSDLNPQQNLADFEAEYNRVLERALTVLDPKEGDFSTEQQEEAAAKLAEFSQTYVEQAKKFERSSSTYQDIFDQVTNNLKVVMNDIRDQIANPGEEIRNFADATDIIKSSMLDAAATIQRVGSTSGGFSTALAGAPSMSQSGEPSLDMATTTEQPTAASLSEARQTTAKPAEQQEEETKTIFQHIAELIMAIPKALAELPMKVWKLFSKTLMNIGKVVGTIAKGIVDGLKGLLENIGKFGQNAAKGIGKFLTEGLPDLAKGFALGVSDLGTKLGEVSTEIVASVAAVITSIGTAAKDLVLGFAVAIQAIPGKIAEAIKDAVGGIGKAAGSVVDTVKGFFGFAEGGKTRGLSLAGEEAPEWVVPTNFRNDKFLRSQNARPDQVAKDIFDLLVGKSTKPNPFLRDIGLAPELIADSLGDIRLFQSGGVTGSGGTSPVAPLASNFSISANLTRPSRGQSMMREELSELRTQTLRLEELIDVTRSKETTVVVSSTAASSQDVEKRISEGSRRGVVQLAAS